MSEIEQYIKQYPAHVQTILSKIRKLIFDIAPEATESMSYGMPAYKINNKPFVYYAAYAKHIGIYATPSAHLMFKEELAPYKQGKGSVQFPHHQDMPYELIKKIIQYKYEELTHQ